MRSYYCFLEAFSRYPLYLLGYGFRFAPAATQKDAVSIGAKVAVILFNTSQPTNTNSPPPEGWRKFGRIFDGVVLNRIESFQSLHFYIKIAPFTK